MTRPVASRRLVSLSIPSAALAISSDAIATISCNPSSNPSPPTWSPYALPAATSAERMVGCAMALDTSSRITLDASALNGADAIFMPTTSIRPFRKPPATAAGIAASSDTPSSRMSRYRFPASIVPVPAITPAVAPSAPPATVPAGPAKLPRAAPPTAAVPIVRSWLTFCAIISAAEPTSPCWPSACMRCVSSLARSKSPGSANPAIAFAPISPRSDTIAPRS